MKKILILAAHPDDEVLGCGGYISKHVSLGAIIKVVIIGEGSTCRYDRADSIEAISAIELRRKHSIEALNYLGINNVKYYDLPCGRFDSIPVIEINKIIEKEIDEFSPDTIFTHSPSDVNNDHQLTYRATEMATRPGAKNKVQRVFAYEVLSSTEWGFKMPFQPNYFEALSERDIENKWAALEFYKTETKKYPFPRSREGVYAQASMRGMQAGLEFSEAYCLVREISN